MGSSRGPFTVLPLRPKQFLAWPPGSLLDKASLQGTGGQIRDLSQVTTQTGNKHWS